MLMYQWQRDSNTLNALPTDQPEESRADELTSNLHTPSPSVAIDIVRDTSIYFYNQTL